MYRPRFDLLSLMEIIAIAAFISGLLASSAGQATWEYQFTQLPQDDRALEKWLADQKFREVSVQRRDKSVVITWQMNVLRGISGEMFTIPDVPWESLGYVSPRALSGSSRWSLLGGSMQLWLTGLALLVCLRLFRRWRRPTGASAPAP